MGDRVKIVCMPADTYGCGYYRLLFAAHLLRKQGHDITLIQPGQKHSMLLSVDRGTGKVVDVQTPPDVDVMVFQRVTSQQVAETFPILRAKGIAVVMDIDDDLDRIDPRNPAWAMLHPANETGQKWTTCAQAARDATVVTVSTPTLLRTYAPRGNGVVLPNFIPDTFWQVERQDSPVLGWAGSLHSHPNDLRVTGGAVARLMREGHQFRVVGPPDGVRQELGLPWEPDTTQALDILRWSLGYSTLGAAMAPLADTVFNQSKSALKVLEGSAVGVPVVFSPRNDYMRVHKESGIGVPAEKPADWYRELKRLASDGVYRNEKSEHDRAAAWRYRLSANAWRWMEIWSDALAVQRGGKARVLAGA